MIYIGCKQYYIPYYKKINDEWEDIHQNTIYHNAEEVPNDYLGKDWEEKSLRQEPKV